MQKEVPTVLTQSATMIWVLVGILTSLVLPVAVNTLKSAVADSGGSLERRRANPWRWIVTAWGKYGGDRYLRVLLAAALVAVVLVFLLGLKFFTSRDAALAGFAWESLVNKLFGRQAKRGVPV